ncbi:hypothetical protein VNO80_16863 [Phaseolus coccineus]|uniref:Uncharacterized protein n=1 Tax=Phaseolus coccineus TaxID=3886 RepID=A0AAN9MN84_PHACN
MPRQSLTLFQHMYKTVSDYFLQKCMDLMFLLCTYYCSTVAHCLPLMSWSNGFSIVSYLIVMCYCIDGITWTLRVSGFAKVFLFDTTERGRGRRNGREIKKRESSRTGVLDWPRAAKNIFKFQKIKRMGTNHGYEVGLHGMQTAQPLLVHREPTLISKKASS